jgi:hypothetical protein
MIQDEESYRYKGVPLTAAVVEHIAKSQLAGQQLKRSQIVDYVEKYHAQHGGFPGQAADLSRTVKKALDNLKANKGAENPSTGWWRISRDVDGEQSGESKDDVAHAGEIDEEETQAFQPLLLLGEGDETIYLYYYPAYKAAALSISQDKWLCKIGRTDSSARLRISCQSTGMPERPEIGLVYRTNDSRTLESVLHGVLTLRNQWSESSPGVEWFITSVEDVLSIIDVVLGHPVIAEAHA